MTASLSQLDTLIESVPVHRGENSLPTPAELRQQIPIGHELQQAIAKQRQAIRAILNGEDDRLLVVVGPCSIHDPAAAVEYAKRLSALARRVEDRLLLVMRVYVEKPRTTIGWKGLVYDPHLDGSNDMAQGLAISRQVMRDIAALGLPVATELLQPMAALYFEDLLGWAAIGARTTESQIHREMASGLDAVVGFKNGTDGGIGVAIDAMHAAGHSHRHFGMDSQGRPVMHETQGNPHTHLVLRGGHGCPNYDASSIADSRRQLEQAGLRANIMVDCSHANSRKDHRRQSDVLQDVLEQRLAGETSLVGVMLESHLNEGKQALDLESLRYGVSITDACLGWDATMLLLTHTAERLRVSHRT